MDDDAFDRALIASAFTVAADRGWPETTVTAAARAAGLPLDRARARFTGRAAILARFGRLADQAALAEASSDGSNRDRLFGLVMRRIDVLHAHRGGVLALKTFLPTRPLLSAALGAATLSSMAWLLEVAGIPTQGIKGALRVKGLAVIWLRTLHAWEGDEGEDLAATMAALDRGLDQAVRAEGWIGGRSGGGTDDVAARGEASTAADPVDMSAAAMPESLSTSSSVSAADAGQPTPATSFGAPETTISTSPDVPRADDPAFGRPAIGHPEPLPPASTTPEPPASPPL